jgi:hypothetical protein
MFGSLGPTRHSFLCFYELLYNEKFEIHLGFLLSLIRKNTLTFLMTLVACWII